VDGYKIKTALFNLRIRLPGEYEGVETSLNEGLHPEVRMQSAACFREYIRERVKVQFDGIDQEDGLIAEAVDEHTGLVDVMATVGNILTIRGYGLRAKAPVLKEHFRQKQAKPRRWKGTKDRRGQIPDRVSIDERPNIVEEKSRAGDWATVYIQVSSKKRASSNLEKRAMCKKKTGLVSLRNGHIGQK
jgi:IS30 family transposase